jgi:TctA family transporter
MKWSIKSVIIGLMIGCIIAGYRYYSYTDQIAIQKRVETKKEFYNGCIEGLMSNEKNSNPSVSSARCECIAGRYSELYSTMNVMLWNMGVINQEDFDLKQKEIVNDALAECGSS